MASGWSKLRRLIARPFGGAARSSSPETAGGAPGAPEAFGPAAVARVQRIARDAVLEPFALYRNLEALKKTRLKIESTVRKLGQAARAAGSGLTKTGAAVKAGWDRAGESEWGAKVGARIKERVGPVWPAGAGTGDWGRRLRTATDALRAVAKSTYDEANRWAGGSGLGYLEEGFRFLLDRDGERWILKRAGEILGRSDLYQLEDVRALSFHERDELIAALYPYRNPALKKYMQAMDQALNLSLGAVVASNIPGTGAAVGALNIVKTILKIGGRVSTMTWLYGGRIAGPGALFRVSARLLKSLEAWESDPDHAPLDPAVLDGLFVQEQDSRGFREMLEAAVRKDAYIAVPGVGTVSVGKIPLDDFRMNLYVRRLAMNYFERDSLRKLAGPVAYDRVHAEYLAIYRELLEQDALAVLYRRVVARRPAAEGRDKWLARWRSITGSDGLAEAVSNELDEVAAGLYAQTDDGRSLAERVGVALAD